MDRRLNLANLHEGNYSYKRHSVVGLSQYHLAVVGGFEA